MDIAFSPVELVIILTLVGLGAIVQGAVGYGMALVASPILLVIEPRFIPGPFTIAASVLVVLVVIRDRQALDFFGLKWAILGLVFGVAAGAFILSRFPGEHYAVIFAVLILVAVAMSVSGMRFPPRRGTLTLAGFLAGLMGMLTTTSGPPMALVYQDAPGKKLRATLSGFFIIGTLLVVGSLSSIGRFGRQEILLSLMLFPSVVMGFLLSSRVTAWIDRGYTRPVILTIATLSAIFVLVSRIW